MSLFDLLLSKKIAGGSGFTPEGKITITENQTDVDVSQYASADVDVHPTKGLALYDYDNNGCPHRAVLYWQGEINVDSYCKGAPNPFLSEIESLELKEGLTGYGRWALQMFIKITRLEYPESFAYNGLGTTALPSSELLEEVVFKNDIKFTNNSLANPSLKRVICKKNVIQLYYCGTKTTVLLYDFSHCTSVPGLTGQAFSNYNFGFAAGCVIRVPQSLLNEWKAATNWCDLPTDTSLDRYVVWEGV